LGWLSRIFCPISERLVVTPEFLEVHLEMAAPMVVVWKEEPDRGS